MLDAVNLYYLLVFFISLYTVGEWPYISTSYPAVATKRKARISWRPVPVVTGMPPNTREWQRDVLNLVPRKAPEWVMVIYSIIDHFLGLNSVNIVIGVINQSSMFVKSGGVLGGLICICCFLPQSFKLLLSLHYLSPGFYLLPRWDGETDSPCSVADQSHL